MYDLEDDDFVGAALKEVSHFVLQAGLRLVLGDDFQAVPRFPAPLLQLNQTLRKIVKVHLGWHVGGKSHKSTFTYQEFR